MLTYLDKISLMKYCCELAKKGLGFTAPNPIVGAVIANTNGEIISEGYHKQYGGLHAEINAINNARINGIDDFSDLILFVSLEPCNHYGKQPPCTEEIIKAGFKNVYVGIEDPNPLVKGKGVTRLQEAGINVNVEIEKKECTKILADYIHYFTKKMPYITLKVAQSIDGFIAQKESELKYLTSENTRKKVHFMRSYCAVLVGINTILEDNPILDFRLLSEKHREKLIKNGSSKIIILDSNLRTPPDSNIFSTKENRKIFIAYSENLNIDISEIKNRKKLLEQQGAILIKSPIKNEKIDLHKLLSLLAKEHKIMHILVEGGGKVFSSFINSKLVNKLIIHTAPLIIVDGVKAFSNANKTILNDILSTFNKNYEMCDKDFVSTFIEKQE